MTSSCSQFPSYDVIGDSSHEIFYRIESFDFVSILLHKNQNRIYGTIERSIL